MKNLIVALAFFAFAHTAFAGIALEYYAADFQIVKTTTVCPEASGKSDFECMGFNTQVVLEAEIECMDEVIHTNFDVVEKGFSAQIFATSVVKRGVEQVHCFAPKKIRKTITVNSIGKIELVNAIVER